MDPDIAALCCARRCFEFAWRQELESDHPNWLLLFDIHLELIDVEERLAAAGAAE